MENKYELIVVGDKRHDGLFYTAVKTTGIYCLPSCTARKPARENVEFFQEALNAEAAGYRPCKRCFPNVLGVPWHDFKHFIELEAPSEFSFEECLVYVNRSETECLHQVKDGELVKFVQFGDVNVLLKIRKESTRLRIDFLNGHPPKWVRAQAAKYVFDWFDWGTDIRPFYELAANDPILQVLAEKYRGLRVIKIHDPFECLCWAVMGQQINLKFAYTLKKRLVEAYGEKLVYEGEPFFLFPKPSVIASLQPEDLKKLQFTSRKAEYIIGIAQLFAEQRLKKEELAAEKEYEPLMEKLMSIRGIGHWTADYTIMKCTNINCAFPLADVGIHNALKGILGLSDKPSLEKIRQLAEGWKNWEAYAAFYLWRWLYD
ncbi:MAG: Ada metal-binding domain-containing protein [Bacillota bacterium]|nr:Ada metal-binding domain-containing protein [Bacillota bacterium]